MRHRPYRCHGLCSDGVTVVKLDNGHKLLGTSPAPVVWWALVGSFLRGCRVDGEHRKDVNLVNGDMFDGAIGGHVSFASYWTPKITDSNTLSSRSDYCVRTCSCEI